MNVHVPRRVNERFLTGIIRPVRRPTRRREVFARELAESELPAELDTLFNRPPATLETQIRYGWNPWDASYNLVLLDDDLTCFREPVLPQTDAIRAKMGVKTGIHAWEVHWPRAQRGTHTAIGVATEDAPIDSRGYRTAIGINHLSWGWDLDRNKLYHNIYEIREETYPRRLREYDETFTVPDNFIMVLDMKRGTLSFIADNHYLGVAFDGLEGKKLYPVASTAWFYGRIALKYIGGIGFSGTPLPLVDLCGEVIRKAIGKDNREEKLKALELPKTLINYLK